MLAEGDLVAEIEREGEDESEALLLFEIDGDFEDDGLTDALLDALSEEDKLPLGDVLALRLADLLELRETERDLEADALLEGEMLEEILGLISNISHSGVSV